MERKGLENENIVFSIFWLVFISNIMYYVFCDLFVEFYITVIIKDKNDKFLPYIKRIVAWSAFQKNDFKHK